MMGGLSAVTAPLWAQQSPDGLRGFQLRFDLEFGIESQSNRALALNDPGTTTEARTALTVGILSETRTQRLAFDLGGELRGIDGPTNDENGFVNPFAILNYDRSSASSRLSLSASVRESDLNNDGFEFDELTQAFTFVEGSATRRRTNLSAEMNFRDDAPFGWGVLARLEDNSFSGGTATGLDGAALNDTRRLTFGITGRFEIDEAIRLNTRLTYATFEQDGTPGSRDTWTLSNDLTIDRPRGNLTFGLDITDTPEGTRVAADVGRSLEYPLGIVSGRVGLVRGASGNTFLSGGLNLTREMPNGNLNLDLARTVSSGSLQDTEQLSTSLRIGYLRELSPVANLSVDFNWAEVSQTSTGIDTTNATISATYLRELTPDWGMNAGVRHRFRDDGVNGSANSNELFLNLRREFLTRF
jgi:hypothetical protein